MIDTAASDHYMNDVVFLALCTWREARGSTPMCRLAVACSIMERAHHPSWWGNDVQSVVGKKWQYSSMTAKGDPQLTVYPTRNDPQYSECMIIAKDVIRGAAAHPAPGADSYYDVSIAPPAWADDKRFVRQIGRIRFYAIGVDHEIPEKGPAT